MTECLASMALAFHVAEILFKFRRSRVEETLFIHVAPWLPLETPLCMFLVSSSFLSRGTSRERGLFWIYALELRPCFCVLYTFLAVGAYRISTQTSYEWWQIEFSVSLGMFQRNKNHSGERNGGDRKTKMEGGRNNFSFAGSCRTSFRKMGVRKLKICKFGLVSKICCFFGSLSCVFVLGDLMRWNAATQDGAVFCWTKSWTDFDASLDDD